MRTNVRKYHNRYHLYGCDSGLRSFSRRHYNRDLARLGKE